MSAALERLGPIHNSHLTAIRRCKRKFAYAFIEGIQPKLPGLPLARGIWLHYCLEAQFLRWGIDAGTILHVPESINVDGVGEVFIVTYHPEDGPYLEIRYDKGSSSFPLSAAGMLRLLTEKVWSRLFDQEKEKYTEDGYGLPEACTRILTEYFYYWKDKPQPEVLLVEIDWSREYEGVTFEGRTDYVVRRPDKGNLIVCGDWKSTKNQPPPFFKFMESQLNLYPWGVAPKLEELGVPVKGIEGMVAEFDYLSTKLPTKPSINKDGSMSKRKINTTYLTLVNFIKENDLKWKASDIEAFLAKNEREFFMRDTFPRNKKVVKALLDENVSDCKTMGEVLEDPSRVTRTVSRNCNWDCDFQELCQGELYQLDMSRVRKTQYEARSNSHAGIVEKDD